jgi:hypothetical protein
MAVSGEDGLTTDERIRRRELEQPQVFVTAIKRSNDNRQSGIELDGAPYHLEFPIPQFASLPQCALDNSIAHGQPRIGTGKTPDRSSTFAQKLVDSQWISPCLHKGLSGERVNTPFAPHCSNPSSRPKVSIQKELSQYQA